MNIDSICDFNLSEEQQLCLDKFNQGHNVFVTGPGGSGKSYLIKLIYSNAIKRGLNIQVTALTGCAAILVGCKAKTLHSWACIGLGNNTIENMVNKIKTNKFSRNIWKNIDVLVVDEISMLSLKLFSMLNEIGKNIRRSNKPFGGIQLIFSGDFYQLPPVGNEDEIDTQRFCFESDEWNFVFRKDCQIQLIRIYRQTDDVFASILNEIRKGKIKRKSVDLLMKCVAREVHNDLLVEPTKLFPTRAQVEETNKYKINSIHGEFTEYEMKRVRYLDMSNKEKILRNKFTDKEIDLELDYLSSNLMCEKSLKLKIGAQVMCLINVNDDIFEKILLCNGSQGVVTSYCEITGFPRVTFNNGIIRVMTSHLWNSEKIPGIGISQVPLILAWALTIHKSQGVSLDMAEIDAGNNIFECGQTYVALSRVKTMDGLYLSSFDVQKIRINKKVVDFYEKLTEYIHTNTNTNTNTDKDKELG
jgi:ATP-dependent DNA helicase PIF1